MIASWSAQPLPVRLGLTLWLMLAIVVTVRVAVQQPTRASVVPIYRTAGLTWRAAGDLYAPTGLDVYRYPPGFAAIFAPFTPLPEKLVAIAWRLIGSVVLVIGLRRFARRTQLTPSAAGWLLGLSALLSIPSVNNGQVNTLLAGAAVNGVVEAMRGRWWRAAGWLSLGTWIKVYPLAVGMLAAMVRLRLAIPLLVVTIAGLLAPYAVADREYVTDQYRRFALAMTEDDRTHGPAIRLPRDWTAIPRTYFGVVVATNASRAVSLAVAVGLAVLSAWRRSLPLTLVLGCGWMTCFGPATEGNTYAILAGPAAWVCVVPGAAWARWIGRLGFGLLLAAVLRGAGGAGAGDFELLGGQPVGALLVMVAAAGLCPRKDTT